MFILCLEFFLNSVQKDQFAYRFALVFQVHARFYSPQSTSIVDVDYNKVQRAERNFRRSFNSLIG